MAVSTSILGIGLLFFGGIVIGGVVLQIFLSRNENKWPGLVLPILSFLLSLLTVFGLVGFTGMDSNQKVLTMLMVLLQANISTAVLIGIYAVCRTMKKKPREIEKMKIQDLG